MSSYMFMIMCYYLKYFNLFYSFMCSFTIRNISCLPLFGHLDTLHLTLHVGWFHPSPLTRHCLSHLTDFLLTITNITSQLYWGHPHRFHLRNLANDSQISSLNSFMEIAIIIFILEYFEHLSGNYCVFCSPQNHEYSFFASLLLEVLNLAILIHFNNREVLYHIWFYLAWLTHYKVIWLLFSYETT